MLKPNHISKQTLLALPVFLALAFSFIPAYTQALTYNEIVQAQTGKVLGDSTMAYPYSSGALVNDGGTIYFVSSTTKIPFTNYAAFRGLGYSLNNVENGNLDHYTPSTSYFITTSKTSHPWGSWLLYNRTIYYSSEKGLIGVPDYATFLNDGGNWKYVVRANSYDIAALNSAPNLPVLVYNDPRIYASSSAVPNIPLSQSPGTTQKNTLAVPASSASSTPPITISSCQSITQPGSYVLDRNLTSTNIDNTCLVIENTSNVQLDCKQFSITLPATTMTIIAGTENGSGLFINNVQNFSISNCGFNYPSWQQETIVTNSSQGNFANNTFLQTGSFYVGKSSNMQITGNTFEAVSVVDGSDNSNINNNSIKDSLLVDGSRSPSITANIFTNDAFVKNMLTVSNSQAPTVNNNSFTITPPANSILAAAINLQNIAGGSVTGNIADGNTNHQPTTGSDDGIVINDVSNMLIQNNSLTNFFDCGIESVGLIDTVNILGNKITNVGYCGIGGWYSDDSGVPHSWKNSIVSNNIVNNSAVLFSFYKTLSAGPGEGSNYNNQPVYFQNNKFSSNKLVLSPTNFPLVSPFFDFVAPYPSVPASNLFISGNIFTNNDFGPILPRFLPGGGFADGGGNLCNMDGAAVDFPLHCTAVSFRPIINLFAFTSLFSDAKTNISIKPGDSAVLSWAVNGPTGTTVSINNGVIISGSSLTGFVSISPTQSTTYTLTASSSAGSATAMVSVSVIPNPTVIAPAGGEQWALGSTHNILWSASSSVSNVTITLSPYGQINPVTQTLAYNIPNTGSFAWQVGGAGGSATGSSSTGSGSTGSSSSGGSSTGGSGSTGSGSTGGGGSGTPTCTAANPCLSPNPGMPLFSITPGQYTVTVSDAASGSSGTSAASFTIVAAPTVSPSPITIIH